MKLDDVFFTLTNTCNICFRENQEGYFCPQCQKDIKYNNVICNKCGRSTINPENFCNSCQNQDAFFEKARSVFLYLEPISLLVQKFKYNGKRYFGRIFAEPLSLVALKEFADADILVNVPMHKKDKFRRGYNQTEILATEISKITGIPFINNVLKKDVRTKRQATLTKQDRKSNLKNVFSFTDKSLVKGKVIILVDDILTTGSTAEIISEKLIKAKAKKVYVLTIASVGEREQKDREEKLKNKKVGFFAKIFQKIYRHKQKNNVQ